MEWTEERATELKTLIASGHSRGDVARLWGVSRNVIVGKAFRLGLCEKSIDQVHVARMGAAVTNGRKQREIALRGYPTKYPKATERRKTPWLAVVATEPAPLLVSLVDLESTHCHWLCEGTDDNCLPQYCGHPSVDGRWCAHHYSRVYEKRR